MVGEIKVLHFGDLHLGMENYGKLDPKTGLNSRFFDFLKVLDKIVEASRDTDLVVFAGDAYKTREPSQTYQREFAKRIKKIAEFCPIVLVVGNHDTPIVSSKANTLDIFKALGVENVYVSGKPEILRLKVREGEVQVATLPWLTKNKLLGKASRNKSIDEVNRLATEKLIAIVKELNNKIDKTIPSILVAHVSVSGAVFGSEQNVMLGSDLILPQSLLENSHFSYIGLGHLHRFQILRESPPIVYCGSPERIDFSESAEDKGYVMVSLKESKSKGPNSRFDVKYQFIKLPARNFVPVEIVLKEGENNPTEKVISEIKKYDIRQAVVKLTIMGTKEAVLGVDTRKLKQVLDDAYYIAALNKKIVREVRDADVRFLEELSPIQILEEYLKSQKMKKAKIKLLCQKAQELIKEIGQSI